MVQLRREVTCQAVLGVAITVLQVRYGVKWVPSATGLGFGLLLPGLLNIAIAIGAVLGWPWQRRSPNSYQRYHFTVAAGLIAGNAMMSGLLPALSYFGIVSPQ